MQSASKVQFYRRVLPGTCIPFSSEEGKRIFTESLLAGYANVFFPLAEQFRTQDQPAYCGLSTLVMALNTLEVDPKRVWKGPWRWYHEDMLDCCFPLDLIQQKGITMDQFICLASCNHLDLNVFRMNETHITIDDFRKTIKEICMGSGRLLICSYSRKGLSQTGDGHFSPIGAYHPEEDLILIMDVARYKYPPHWVTVNQLWESMKYEDKVTISYQVIDMVSSQYDLSLIKTFYKENGWRGTEICRQLKGLPRGYIIMRKTQEMPLLVFRLSTTFRVTIATHDLSSSHMAKFLTAWRGFLNEDRRTCGHDIHSLDGVITSALKGLNEALAFLLEGESIFTTQFSMCCVGDLHVQHIESAKKLLLELESTEMYSIVGKWVKGYLLKQATMKPCAKSIEKGIPCAKKSNCCRLKRVGKAYTDDQKKGDSSACASSEGMCRNMQKARDTPQVEEPFVSDSHYITMLLFSWPYEMEFGSPYTKCLANYVEEALVTCDEMLVNEAKQLRQQIQSLIIMVKEGRS